MTHTILALVDNKPGVVSRVSGLFTRRGYNIESLVTGVTDDPAVYHLTIIAHGNAAQKAQLVAQLQRIQEVISVSVAGEKGKSLTREMMLIKVDAKDEPTRRDAKTLAADSGCRLVGESDARLVFEATGSPEDLLLIRKRFSSLSASSVRGGAISVTF